MADKVEKILDIKVNYNEAIKAIAEYQTKIDKAKEAEAKLKEQLKAGDIKRQQYNEEMAASKAYINDCNDSIRVITKTMQNQLKQEKAQENSLVSLRAKLSNLTAEYDALSEARNATAWPMSSGKPERPSAMRFPSSSQKSAIATFPPSISSSLVRMRIAPGATLLMRIPY